MTAKYYVTLTDYGATQVAQAHDVASITLAQMVIGDANGIPYDPIDQKSRTSLVNQRATVPVQSVTIEGAVTTVTATVAANIGGFNLHEIGLKDSTGQLVYIGNYHGGYKPAIAEGAGGELTIVIDITAESGKEALIEIDPNVVTANKNWVVENFASLLALQETDSRLTAAITALASAIQSNLVLTGTTILWCSKVVPVGYLELDGQEISRFTYPALFALFGTTFGAGDDATTFNLPDLRGEFVRGWNHGREDVDIGREFGSFQHDAIRNITGSLKADVQDWGNTQFVDGLQAEGAFERINGQKSFTGDNSGGNSEAWGARFDASLVVPTAEENRPRNVALMYIIKT
jgi:phage-related tail fiber protein